LNPFRDGFLGKSWWEGFKKRHPELVLQTIEGLDRDRALNLCPVVVTKFYDTYPMPTRNIPIVQNIYGTVTRLVYKLEGIVACG
jgi:hypothetical protein